MLRLVIALSLLLSAGSPSSALAEAPIVAEARKFMEAYAKDLARGDREAIAARYDRSGVFFLVAGGREFVPYDAVAKDYRETWSPPATFEWQDLHFDPIGSEAVVVNGRFAWGLADRTQLMTYTGFLRREDGQLRIRLEDETPVPPKSR